MRIFASGCFLVATAVTICAQQASPSTAHHTFRYLTSSGYPQHFTTMQFSPDSRQLAVVVNEQIHFIDPQLGRVTGQFKASPFSLNYTRDGNHLYLISTYEAKLLDTLTGAALPVKYEQVPGYLGIALEKQSGKLLIQSINPAGPAFGLESLQVGDELIAMGEGRNASFYDVTGNEVSETIERLKGPAGTYLQLKILPRGTIGDDNARIVTLRRHPAERTPQGMRFKPITPPRLGESLAWCMVNHHHEFRNCATGLPIAQLTSTDVESLGQYAISPDQTKFAIVARTKQDSSRNAVEVFDIATQDRLAYIPLEPQSYYDIAFAHDNQRVLVATWDTIEVGDIRTQQVISTLTLGFTPPPKDKDEDSSEGGFGIGASVMMSVRDSIADGSEDDRRSPRQLVSVLAASSKQIVATGSPFGEVKLWDIASGHLLKTLPPNPDESPEQIIFSPDGKWLAYHIEGILHVVDVSSVNPLTEAQLAAIHAKQQAQMASKSIAPVALEEAIPGLDLKTPQQTVTPATNAFKANDKVEVFSRGRWYPATIVRSESAGYWMIHYDDSPQDWDESVAATRMRSRAL